MNLPALVPERLFFSHGHGSILHILCTALFVICLGAGSVFAAGTTLENPDRNYWIAMIDALADGPRTRIFYVTYPDISQPHVREKCTANYYMLDLQPKLTNLQPKLVAENFCGHSLDKSGGLLANGDAVIVSGDRIETWRPGAGRIGSWALSDVDSVKSYGPNMTAGGMQSDISPDGNIVAAALLPRKRNDTESISGVVVGLSPSGSTRWQLELAEPNVLLGVMDIWATADGGALLHVTARPMTGVSIPGAEAPEGAVINGQNRLYRVSADGRLSNPIVIASMQMLDMSSPPPPLPDMTTDPEGYQAALTHQARLTRMDVYTDDQLIAQARDDGSIDVLMGRGTRDARFMRIGRNGEVLRDTKLDAVLAEEGLPQWRDGYANDSQVMLFGAVSSRQYRLGQGYVAWIDIEDGSVITRVAPLSELGRDAASKAGDAEVQFLEHKPSQDPKMLTRLDGKPLMVSVVWRSRRPALQIDEATDQLVVYTEARDERRAKEEKKAQRKQRKENRNVRMQQLDVDMAAAIGVSPEEYAAMSRKERKEAMVRSGDMNAMMAAAMKQGNMAQQQDAQLSKGAGGDMNAQMAAAMAQMQQMAGAQGAAMPATPAAASSPPSGEVVELDAGRKGFVEFEHPDGKAVTLLINDKQTGRELLRKDYADGSIYEYIDFSRFGIPLNQIDVVYRDANNKTQTLGNPALVIGN
jgi:hypothetical protein